MIDTAMVYGVYHNGSTGLRKTVKRFQ